MNIELSQTEIELLQDALECWEKDASSGAMIGSLLGIMLSPPDKRDEEKRRNDMELEKARKENMRRKNMSALQTAAVSLISCRSIHGSPRTFR